MDIDINWLAITLATLSSFAIGALWYSPLLFLEKWRKLVGLSKEDLKEGPGGRGWLLTVVGGFLQAFVLYHATYLLRYYNTDYSWFTSAIVAALWLWVGMQVAMLFVHDSFEKRPIQLTVITAGSQLATLAVMGLIIGVL